MKTATAIKRKEAIELLARNDLLDREIRANKLDICSTNFGWNGDLSLQKTYSWNDDLKKLTEDTNPNPIFVKVVAADLSDEFQYGRFSDVMDEKYDDILMELLREDHAFTSNEDLLEELKAFSNETFHITDNMELCSCPCCGANTLIERHGWGICSVCWWEDDGTDNDEASAYYSGPNNGLQLTAARINFALTGIYNPGRKKLMENKKRIENYVRGRIFEINAEKGIIFEKGTDWYAPLSPPHLKEEENENDPKVSLAGAGMRDWPPNIE